MKVEIKGQLYDLVWGTKCFVESQRMLGIPIDAFINNVGNPEYLTVMIYNALSLGAYRDQKDMPFDDFQDFIEKYDTAFAPEVYGHIITDMLESTYLGEHLHKYLTKVYGIEFTDLDDSIKAKKKYLSTLEKSSSTSQVGGLKQKKSTTSRSRSTKSTGLETKQGSKENGVGQEL